MKLSTELIAEMASMSKRMRDFGELTTPSATIESAGVTLSLDAFMKTFKNYTFEELESREKFYWYKTVAHGVLFSAIARESEVIAHIERSKHND